jgi:DNA-binding transcriptional ArsR family regulator
LKITVDKKSIEVSIILMGLFIAENLEYINETYKELGLSQTKEVNDFLKVIQKNKIINKEKLSYYFKNYDIYNNSVNYCINYMMDIDYKGKNFKDVIEELCNKDKQDIFNDIIFSISETKLRSGKKAREYVSSLVYIDEEIVMEHINDFEGFYEYKWKLAELMSKGEAIYKEFAEFLIECRNILEPHMEKLINIGEKWANYLENELSSKGIEFINSIIKVNYDGVESIVVHPKVIESYNCIVYSSEDFSELELEFGYRIFDLIDSFQGKDEDEWFANVLKCLSDGSRYEMLRLLSQREMYGGELAAAMNLSVGTISYHTTNLLFTGLIKEKKVNSRIYYEVDKEKLLKWSKIFEETFKS